MEKDKLKSKCRLLFIGGSAGSLNIIFKMLPGIRPDVSFPVIIVIHRKISFYSHLSGLLASKTSLLVKEVEEKDALTAGCIYIAPAGYHLLIEKDYTLSPDFSEKVNYSRPGIDVTFKTAAEAYQSALVCLLLSRANADGTEGIKIVKKWEGKIMVQNPATAKAAYVPECIIASGMVDVIIDAEIIAGSINLL